MNERERESSRSQVGFVSTGKEEEEEEEEMEGGPEDEEGGEETEYQQIVRCHFV